MGALDAEAFAGEYAQHEAQKGVVAAAGGGYGAGQLAHSRASRA